MWREREPYCAAYVYTTEQVQQPKAIDLNNADRELERTIRQCRLGNALAWEALVKHFQAQVYGFAYYYLRNRAEAQDATQDVFIKVFNSLNKLEQKEAAFPAWLLTIARNTCLDRLRKSRTRAHYEDAYEKTEVRHNLAAASTESDEQEHERRRLMYQVLAEFDAGHRDVVMLKDIQGLKLEEVAEILSLPVGTVKSRSNRARLALAKRLAELGADNSGAKEAM